MAGNKTVAKKELRIITVSGLIKQSTVVLIYKEGRLAIQGRRFHVGSRKGVKRSYLPVLYFCSEDRHHNQIVTSPHLLDIMET